MKIDLNRALKKLRKAYRECIVLKYFYDKPVKEISLIMGGFRKHCKNISFQRKERIERIVEGGYFED